MTRFKALIIMSVSIKRSFLPETIAEKSRQNLFQTLFVLENRTVKRVFGAIPQNDHSSRAMMMTSLYYLFVFIRVHQPLFHLPESWMRKPWKALLSIYFPLLPSIPCHFRKEPSVKGFKPLLNWHLMDLILLNPEAELPFDSINFSDFVNTLPFYFFFLFAI